MNKKIITIFIMLILLNIFDTGLNPVFVKASPDSAIYYAEATRSGYITKWGGTYPPTTHSLAVAGDYEFVGQKLVLDYYIYRGFISFDTSGIHDEMEIVSANLSIAIPTGYDLSLTDFYVKVYSGKGKWTSFSVGLWDLCTNYEGYLDTNGISENTYYNITITPTQINKTGTTQFRLISSRDESATAPTGYEHVGFEKYDGSLIPRLQVSWTTPPPSYYVDDDTTLDGTVSSYTNAYKTLVATTNAFASYDVGDAVEFISGTADGFVTNISIKNSDTSVVLNDAYGSDFTDGTFNLVDLDAPSSTDPFRYIQSAINLVPTGLRVIVHDGTYDGFHVNKDNIIVQASSSPVISGTCVDDGGGNSVAVLITAYGVTIDGLTITAECRNGIVVQQTGGVCPSGTVIKNNVIDVTGFDPGDKPGSGDANAIVVKAGSGSQTEITGNTIKFTYCDPTVPYVGIHCLSELVGTSNSNPDLVISNNIITLINPGGDRSNEAKNCRFIIVTTGESGSAQVLDNTLSAPTWVWKSGWGRQGIDLAGQPDNGHIDDRQKCHDVIVEGNTISELDKGVWINGGGVQDINITGNTFNHNAYGIHARKDAYLGGILHPTGVTVHYNNIQNSPWLGFYNENVEPAIDAENNWWGDATGPYNATSNPSASGDEVYGDVDYIPWLDDYYPAGISRSYNVKNINTAAEYNSIQAAINAASSGHTLQVYKGNYTEDLTINGKTNLTLKSVSGASLTNITGTGTGPVVTIQGGSNDFTLGGSGFTITGGSSSTRLVLITNGESGVTIRDSILYSRGNPNMGICVGAAGADGLSIINNIFFMNETDVGIYCDGTLTNLTVSSNNFTGPANGNSNSVKFVDTCAATNAMISGNTIRGATSRIELGSSNINNVTYQGNTFNETQGAILITETATDTLLRLSNLTVTGNVFGASSLDSYAFLILDTVEIGDFDNDSIIVNWNSIDSGSGGPTFETVSNDATGGTKILNAEYNWWGHTSGPSVAGPGSGEAVSTNVDYTPWINVTITNATSKKTGAGTYSFDAKAAADVFAIKAGSGTPVLTCVLYGGNPQAALDNATGKYYDVSINTTSGVTSLTIRFYYTATDIAGVIESNLELYFWNKTSGTWNICDPQTLHTGAVNGYSGYIEVIISSTSKPSLINLASDLPFAPAAPPLTKFNLNIRALNYVDTQVLSGATVYMTNSTSSYSGTVDVNGWYNFTGISDDHVTWWIKWQGSTVYYISSQTMGTHQTIEAKCKVTNVIFSAEAYGDSALPSAGCQWHIIVQNGSYYVYDQNPVTVNDLVNGTYNLRVKWMGTWVSGNVSWSKDVETIKELETLVTDVVFNASDSNGNPLDDSPCYWVIEYPNGTVQTHNGHAPTVTLGNGTYKLGVKWQGTYVVSNETWPKTTETSYSKNCSEIVDRTFIAKDDSGNQLWSDVTKMWITFPNGTTYSTPSNSSNFTLQRLASGTYTIKIYFEGSKVLGWKTYTIYQEDVPFICSVYQFVPVLQDIKNVTYSGGEIYLSCPNGTISSFMTGSDGKITIPQIQNGSFSIPNVTYNGHTVNQTSSFNIGSNLVDWIIQFNGLSIGQTDYSSTVHLNSTFTVKVQLVYNYTGTPVPSGSLVGLIGASEINATTDSSGWATFTLEEWQPVDPYTVFGMSETGYGLTYPMQNASITISWLGDFNIEALDAAGNPLKTAELLIYNETGLWQTLNTDNSGFIHVQDAVTQNYVVDVNWKSVNVGSVSFNLDRSVIDRTVSCTVYSGYVRVSDLSGSPLDNIPVEILWFNEDLYEDHETGADGSTPQIYQIPGGTYVVNLTYLDSVFMSNIEVSQDFDFQYEIANVSMYGVPGIENFIYDTDSTVKTITHNQIFSEVFVEINGTSGSSGHFNLFVPKAFLDYYGLTINNIHIFFDSVPLEYTAIEYTNGYLIATSYTHSDHEIEIISSDITLTLSVRDANSNGLDNAYIKLYRDGYSSPLKTGHTNSNGQLIFTNLPTGNYSILTYQRGVLVDPIDRSNELTITSSTVYAAKYYVYDLNVVVIDAMSTPLQGSTVKVFLPNGTALETATADGSGTAFFHQMPTSNYNIEATYWSVTNSTTSNLIENLNIQIRIPMLNMLTLVVLIFMIGGVITLIGTYYSRKEKIPIIRKRRGRRKKGTSEPMSTLSS